MKKYRLKLSMIIAGVAFLLGMAGCTDSFERVNTDPDRANDAPVTNQLAYVICYASTTLFDPWNDMNEPSTYGGHLAKIQYIDESRYAFRTGTVENKWFYVYLTLNNVKDIRKRSAEQGLVNMESAAKVWEAMLMSIATDTWRDVPYSEAARLDEGILLPRYDRQEEIYPAMLEMLATAAEGFASGASDPMGEGDVLFNGDVLKWQKYCNSMRLRLAMRISKVDAALAKSTVEQIMGNPAKYPVMEDNKDNAFFVWPGEAPYIEPWAEDSRKRDDYAVSDVLVDLMKSLDDPRLPSYAHPASDGEFRGSVIGAASQASDLSLFSRIGARFRDEFKGFTPYYRSAEVYFHLAEAAKLGWTVGISAKDAYEKGVTLSLAENDIEDATDYLNGPAKFNDTLEQIYEQEWIALFKQGMEGWSLFRRTGVPATIYYAPGSKYVGHNTPPFRYPYPINESSLNGANVEPFKAEIKDDFWGKQMWWDTRTGVQ